MKKPVRILAAAILAATLLPLAGCSLGSNGIYRSIKKLDEQNFCVAFRQHDDSAEAVIAAMKVVRAEGEVARISQKWFGSDVSMLSGDINALENLEYDTERRIYNIGYDAGRMPFSGREKNSAAGFDVEFAKAVFKKLGWRTKFIAVDVANAEVELNSGNVDCVWGAYEYDGESKVKVSPDYAASTVVVVSRTDSDVGSVGALKGRTLMFGDNSYFEALVGADGALSSNPGYIVEVSGGTGDCFKALDKGECDAIVADRYSMDYYR